MLRFGPTLVCALVALAGCGAAQHDARSVDGAEAGAPGTGETWAPTTGQADAETWEPGSDVGDTDAGAARPMPHDVGSGADGGTQLCDETTQAPEHAAALLQQPADSWSTLPNTRMTAHCPEPAVGGNSCAKVVSSASGGALDESRSELYVWGGGATNYAGNEVYRFSILEARWSRLTEPSAIAPEQELDRDPLADGMPVARQTYGGLVWLQGRDSLLAFGGARASDGSPTRVTWLFSRPDNRWTQAAAHGASPGSSTAYNLGAAFDPATQRALFRDVQGVHSYDPSMEVWVDEAVDYRDWGPISGAVDTARGIFFTLGAGTFDAYAIDDGKDVSSLWREGAPAELLESDGPGLAYDPASDSLVAWAGGAPWIFDLEHRSWSRGSAADAPPTQQLRGTFGRWRYVPSVNAFALVNSGNEDVAIYKHTADCG